MPIWNREEKKMYLISMDYSEEFEFTNWSELCKFARFCVDHTTAEEFSIKIKRKEGDVNDNVRND